MLLLDVAPPQQQALGIGQLAHAALDLHRILVVGLVAGVVAGPDVTQGGLAHALADGARHAVGAAAGAGCAPPCPIFQPGADVFPLCHPNSLHLVPWLSRWPLVFLAVHTHTTFPKGSARTSCRQPLQL